LLIWRALASYIYRFRFIIKLARKSINLTINLFESVMYNSYYFNPIINLKSSPTLKNDIQSIIQQNPQQVLNFLKCDEDITSFQSLPNKSPQQVLNFLKCNEDITLFQSLPNKSPQQVLSFSKCDDNPTFQSLPNKSPQQVLSFSKCDELITFNPLRSQDELDILPTNFPFTLEYNEISTQKIFFVV